MDFSRYLDQLGQRLGELRPGYRFDAAESAFFARELEHVYARTYDIKYPQFRAREFIPVSNEADAGSRTVTYQQFDSYGRAKVISGNAKDVPRVDIDGTEFSRPVRPVALAYGWDMLEMLQARMAGRSLDDRRARACRRGIEEKLDYIACFGDAESGITDGFLNNSNIPSATAANGAAGTPEWTTKTAQEIMDDLKLMVETIVDNTNGIHEPTDILLPNKAYTHIATTQKSDASDVTILKWVLENFPSIQRVSPWYRLNDAAATDHGRAVAYERDPEVVQQEIPMEFTQLAPQEEGFETVVNCWAITAGTQVAYPKACYFLDEVQD